ncbi:hypothetical protein RB620_18925 [Paenibacillus sp. LHD-117]|uniref:hypothetical protein n=1 Tax=Paenibacillus sp. LHD-117 TaxID=3071412 RepID=UPI0027DF07D7|nr:hypothetical protein [Paenibacillus sp. LHD-117]MDQ6421503.1 hypothetical protein [Paenibacillus sp. LHD-117]
MALRVIGYSLVMVILLYLTVVFLPESLNINRNVSRALLVVITAIFFTLSKNKWWINVVSLILGVFVFWILIFLFVR